MGLNTERRCNKNIIVQCYVTVERYSVIFARQFNNSGRHTVNNSKVNNNKGIFFYSFGFRFGMDFFVCLRYTLHGLEGRAFRIPFIFGLYYRTRKKKHFFFYVLNVENDSLHIFYVIHGV